MTLRFMILMLAALPLAGQTLTGSLVGQVSDSSDAPVPSANVTVTNRQTNAVRTVQTNERGAFSIPSVPSGAYRVRVEKSGFTPSERAEISVSINTVTRADLRLEVQGVSERVTVDAQTPVLQTDRAETRAEIASATLTQAPVPPGRNYQNLLITVPGFTPPESSNSIPSNPARALTFSVNGTSRGGVNIRIDGATATNVYLHHITAYVPAIESIETVNVVTSSFDAEQGLAGGASVNVQIRSGTNETHGAAFEYSFNNRLKAKNFFLPATERNPKLVFNQFGGRLGGPIRKDRLFYFLSYEGTLDRRFASRFATVPTAAMRTGNLTDAQRIIYDPATGNQVGQGRSAFPGNQIPASQINAISRKVIDLYPLPTYTNRLQNNYYASAPFNFDRHTFDTKVNWVAASKLTGYARLSYLRFETYNDPVFGARGGGVPINGGNSGYGWGHTWNGTLAATYVLSPHFILDGNFGYTLMDTNVEPPRLNENLGRDFLGLPGTNGTRVFEGGYPMFNISGFASLGAPDSVTPYYRHDPVHQYVANASWLKGSHNVRFGVDASRLNLNHGQAQFNGANFGASGGFGFAGGPTAIAGGASPNEYNAIGTFLLGLPTTWGRTLQVPDEYTTRTSQVSLYIRDQWQATRKLTLSYGLRYETFPMPVRADRGLERYDFERNKMLLCGLGDIPKDCGTKQGQLNFAPRLGVAYRPGGDWVVRAGYGLNWDPLNLVRLVRTNYPVVLALNGNSPNAFWYAGRTFEQGIPAVQVPSNGNGVIDMPANFALTTVGSEFRRGYVQSFNFTVQKPVRWGFVGQVAYVGTRSIRQAGRLDLNAGQIPGAGAAGQPYNAKFGRLTQTAIATSIGHSTYNALQATLERRFAKGLLLNMAYTYSKVIGVCCNENSDGNARIQALAYTNLNRALMEFDRTQNFQLTAIYELPFGRGRQLLRSGVASWLAGGWQVNSITSWYSGTPFSVTADGTSLNMTGNAQRADQVKTVVSKLGGIGPGQAYYDWTAFAPVREARFGTAGYSTLRGPSSFNSDLGLFREFRLGEKVQMQFRAEAFNFTNTPKFANPSTNISGLRLRNAADPSSFTGGVFEITSTSGVGRDGIDERLFRLGLRLSF